MKRILWVALIMILFTEISCSSARSGNKMVSFDRDGQPRRYRGSNRVTSTIIGVVKDNVENRPIADATIELYGDDHLSHLLVKTMTGARGRFTFTVNDGMYFIVINHPKFKEEKIVVPVKGGGDVDLNEIRLSGFYE